MLDRQAASDWIKANPNTFTDEQLAGLSISMHDFTLALKKSDTMLMCSLTAKGPAVSQA